ncbi:nucleotidyltransferase family protein [Haladaptatus pallidirubidus]
MWERKETTIPNLNVDLIVEVIDETPATLTILYGSYARGDATVTSDIDLAVEFGESLSSSERTQARLDLVERLTTKLNTDAIDVVPLSQVPPALLEEILTDGILIYGSPIDVERYSDQTVKTTSHQERLAEFDDLLADLEQVV